MVPPIEFASHRRGGRSSVHDVAIDTGRAAEDRIEHLKRYEGSRERAMIVCRTKGPPLPPGASNLDRARRLEASVEADSAVSRVVTSPSVYLATGRSDNFPAVAKALSQQAAVRQQILDEEDRWR